MSNLKTVLKIAEMAGEDVTSVIIWYNKNKGQFTVNLSGLEWKDEKDDLTLNSQSFYGDTIEDASAAFIKTMTDTKSKYLVFHAYSPNRRELKLTHAMIEKAAEEAKIFSPIGRPEVVKELTAISDYLWNMSEVSAPLSVDYNSSTDKYEVFFPSVYLNTSKDACKQSSSDIDSALLNLLRQIKISSKISAVSVNKKEVNICFGKEGLNV